MVIAVINCTERFKKDNPLLFESILDILYELIIITA